MEEDVEEITPLMEAIFEAVRRQLAGEGFQLKAIGEDFVRRHDGVSDCFLLVCLDAAPGYGIQPDVGVRIERVEQIFHQTSGFKPQYQGGTSTMGTNVGILWRGDARACQFRLESEAEVPSVAAKIMEVFRQVALPYFERWGSLAAIDAELNNTPGERSIHRGLAWFRCSTGIIVAKLVGRGDYEKLAAFYLKVMTRDHKGFYLKRFQSLLKSLESIEPGSGLSPQ